MNSKLRRQHTITLGARDFSSAVSGFCQVFIVTPPLVASAYGRRRVGLRPTPKIPAAREKNLWYPGWHTIEKACFFKFFFRGVSGGGVREKTSTLTLTSIQYCNCELFGKR